MNINSPEHIAFRARFMSAANLSRSPHFARNQQTPQTTQITHIVK